MYGVWYNYLIEKLNFSNELVNILKKIGSYLNYLFINRFCEEGDIVMRKNDFPNDEQLRVFISSAQSNEGGLAWGEVRCKIKDYLKECILIRLSSRTMHQLCRLVNFIRCS